MISIFKKCFNILFCLFVGLKTIPLDNSMIVFVILGLDPGIQAVFETQSVASLWNHNLDIGHSVLDVGYSFRLVNTL